MKKALCLTKISGGLLWLAAFCLAQPAPRVIIDRVLAQVESIYDYQVAVAMQIEAPNFRMPRKEFMIWYKGPNQFKIKAEGLVLLPKMRLYPDFLFFLRDSVVIKRVQQLKETDQGYYVLDAEPRTKQKFPVEMQFYIDPQRWTVERVIVQNSKVGKSEVRNVYRAYENFWLPETTRVMFEMRKKPGGVDGAMPPPLVEGLAALGDSNQNELVGRMLIVYRDYRLNTGLKDEIFQEKSRR